MELEKICELLDAYRTNFVELVDWAYANGYDDSIDAALYALSHNLYNLYTEANGHRLLQYKISLYLKYTNKFYGDKKLGLTPYFELAREFARYFFDKVFDCKEWLRDFIGVTTKAQYAQYSYKFDTSLAHKMKCNKLVKPMNVTVEELNQYLLVVRDYAFNENVMVTNNDGDRSAFLIIDRTLNCFLDHDDPKGYLKEGIQYYLKEIQNYQVVL